MYQEEIGDRNPLSSANPMSYGALRKNFYIMIKYQPMQIEIDSKIMYSFKQAVRNKLVTNLFLDKVKDQEIIEKFENIYYK